MKATKPKPPAIAAPLTQKVPPQVAQEFMHYIYLYYQDTQQLPDMETLADMQWTALCNAVVRTPNSTYIN
jgi:hypothetical protein